MHFLVAYELKVYDANFQLNKFPMILKNIEGEAICSVDYAFRRIGGKYKGRIIWYLHQHSVLRYGELRKAIKDITPKMLTQTLRELETDQLIARKVYVEVPPKVEYSLTASGQELIPFIRYLSEWGDRQMSKEGLNVKIVC